MVGALIENLFDAFLRPRRSVRQLFGRASGPESAYLLVLLSYLVREIFILVIPGARTFDGPMPLAGYMVDLIESYVTFGLLVFAVYHVGRMFGGVGTMLQTALAIGWYLLVLTVLTPVVVPASVSFLEAVQAAQGKPDTAPVVVPGGSMIVLAVASCISMWLLAAYVTELHRFERTWQVLLVMIGLSMGVSILAVTLLQNL